MSSKEYWLCLPLQVREILASVFCTRLVHAFFTEQHTPANRWICSGNVAENMRVCRWLFWGMPNCSTILRISGSKPMSSMRSASSSISILRESRATCGTTWHQYTNNMVTINNTWTHNISHDHTTCHMTTQQANTLLCESNCNIKQGFMPPCKWWRASFIHKWTKVSDHLPLRKLRQHIYHMMVFEGDAPWNQQSLELSNITQALNWSTL